MTKTCKNLRSTAAALLSLLVGNISLAQSPATIARTLIDEIERSQKLDASFEAIDWEGAFDALDPAMKQQMGFKSVEDFKKHELASYDGEGEKVADSLASVAANADKKEQERLLAMKNHLQDSLRSQKEESDKAFAETDFTVGETTIDGDTAEVEILKKRNKSVSKETLHFVQKNGEWKLVSAAPLNPVGGSSQLPTLLGPSISSATEGVIRPF